MIDISKVIDDLMRSKRSGSIDEEESDKELTFQIKADEDLENFEVIYKLKNPLDKTQFFGEEHRKYIESRVKNFNSKVGWEAASFELLPNYKESDEILSLRIYGKNIPPELMSAFEFLLRDLETTVIRPNIKYSSL